MDRLSKHGIGWSPKIKYHARRIQIAVVLAFWVLSILACSQGYVSNYDLTATALFSQAGAGGADSIPEPGTPVPENPLPTLQSDPEILPASSPTSSIVTSTPDPNSTETPPILYYTQAGDTLPAVAVRFGVALEEITSPESISPSGLLSAGKLLIIPNRLLQTGPGDLALPDSEIVYSPSALDFDIKTYVSQAGGYLAGYSEYLAEGWLSGAQVIQKVATENSINPRLLVALVEYQASWVYGQPGNLAETDYPMGYINYDKKGLYKQLSWAVQQLSIGYYGWRQGILTDITFLDQESMRFAPQLNAGTTALQYLFSRLYNRIEWNGVMYGNESFSIVHERMFGNPWVRAQTVEPLLPINLTQPDMILPFLQGHTWSFTGGPHSAWGPDGARAALDFAPSSVDPGCAKSEEWITAVADGLVVRTGTGIVVLDLDGDGYEQTGWAILYLHVASQGKVQANSLIAQGDLIGHPSCEGGTSTGTHVHIARKYNGEWVLADGPLPFTMNGWVAQAGDKPYIGSLIKDNFEIEACTCGSFETRITRPSGN